MNLSKKKLALIANVFPELRTRKEAVSKVFKKWRFIVPIEKQHGKGAQTHFKPSRGHLYHTYWSPIRKLSLKKLPSVICKMLRLFVNTFTADGKDCLQNRDNFTQPIQIQLVEIKKMFSESFSAVLKFRLNFERFRK